MVDLGLFREYCNMDSYIGIPRGCCVKDSLGIPKRKYYKTRNPYSRRGTLLTLIGIPREAKQGMQNCCLLRRCALKEGNGCEWKDE